MSNFKVGDRVSYSYHNYSNDTGIITNKYSNGVWWCKWDSDKGARETYISERFLTKIEDDSEIIFAQSLSSYFNKDARAPAQSKFKVGDRVLYKHDGLVDTGYVIEKNKFANNWYTILWDSRNITSSIADTHLEKIVPETDLNINEENVLFLLSKAAKLCIDNGEFDYASKILQLIKG